MENTNNDNIFKICAALLFILIVINIVSTLLICGFGACPG